MERVRGSMQESRARRRRFRGVALVAAIPLALVTACSGGGGAATTGKDGDDEPTPTVSTASLAFEPATGSQTVRPDTEVTVTAGNGTLTSVRAVDEDGDELPGRLGTGKTTWTATGRLGIGTEYTITATAVDEHGLDKTGKATFTTLQPPEDNQVKAGRIAPIDGWTVGVAQPLAVGFNHPVKNRAEVQKALAVESTPKVNGAWYWIDDEYVHFRPKDFWPAGAKVTLHANIEGVDFGNGYWGAADRTISFTIGREQIIRVDVKQQRLWVVRDGEIILDKVPVTTGKEGWETRNGTKVIMGKERDKRWTNESIEAPEEYDLRSEYAMRMTNSGEFIHDNTWSSSLGDRATSHGCVGMRPKDARWLYENTIIGDAVVVTGSPKPYKTIWNRYQDWNVPWETWSAGNA